MQRSSLYFGLMILALFTSAAGFFLSEDVKTAILFYLLAAIFGILFMVYDIIESYNRFTARRRQRKCNAAKGMD